MSNYYQMRDAKVRIAHALMANGWKVYGYTEDRSDSMTDYYDPAHWNGIATKNSYILVVDQDTARDAGREITKYNPAGNLSADDQAKLKKLQEMREDRGATPEEADTARKMAEKLQSKISGHASRIVVDAYPVYMANPGRSKWHIEKDGKIYDKGTALTKYAGLPSEYEFDLETMEFKPGYTHWGMSYGETERRKRELSGEQLKNVQAFKTFLLRIENIAAGVAPMGDGTEETEQEGLEAQARQGYEKITVTETKTTRKPVKVDRTTIEEGDIFTFSYHGGFWQVVSVWANNKGNCYTYELLGSEKRGYQRLKNGKRYYQTEGQLKKAISEGKCVLHTMQEVTESFEVEKWVKIEPKKATKPNNSTETATPNPATDNAESPISHSCTITADTDTRDNSPLWVVKITDRLSREDYIKVAEAFKALKGYYSKYKSGFIFRYDPTQALQGANAAPQHQESNNNTNPTDTQPEQPTAGQAQAEKADILERIEKGITALQDKIEALSGDYKTNTHKRMQEQAGREHKIEGWGTEIRILEYVKGKLADNLPITALEKGLTVGTFRDDMRYYYNQMIGARTNKHAIAIEYPRHRPELPADDWRNVDAKRRTTRLKTYANINSTAELHAAIDEYKVIYESVEGYTSPTQQKIKRLMNEYKLQQKGDINFTPATVAAEMIRMSRIDHNSRVLEPSAGIGNIADQIKQVTEHLDVCERMHGFSELLKLKGHNVVSDDFLLYNRRGYYDAIIMNPPFSNNQDIAHLRHAYELLKSDGVLVGITSPHWTFASDKASRDFREWLEQLDHYTKELPSGTFEMTGVRSQIVVIEKREEAMQEAI